MNAETCLYHVRETRAYNITRAQERIRAGESTRDERLLIAVMDRILEASNAAFPEPVPATNQAGEVEPVGALLICDQTGGRMWTCWPVPHMKKQHADSVYGDTGGYRIVPLYAALATQPATSQVTLDAYDAGLLGDGGGGDVDWWQDYIRSELQRAHEFYCDQVSGDAR